MLSTYQLPNHWDNQNKTFIDTIIIGAGPSGLATGFHLKELDTNYLILERSSEVGSAWKYLPDNFQLAMPVSDLEMSGLDLSQFKPEHHLTRDEIIVLLKEYAEKHELCIRFNTNITEIIPNPNGEPRFFIKTSQNNYSTNNIVVCIGPRQNLNYPSYVEKLNPDLVIHSAHFKNLDTLPNYSKILIVGSGLSSLSIAHDIRTNIKTLSHKVYLACAYDDFEVIWRNQHLFFAKNQPANHRPPLVNYFLPSYLKKMGVTNYGRLIDVTDEGLLFKNESKQYSIIANNFDKIIFATGYKYSFPFLKNLPGMKEDQFPSHNEGVTSIPGLFIVGIPTNRSTQQTVTINQGNKEAKFISDYIKLDSYFKPKL